MEGSSITEAEVIQALEEAFARSEDGESAVTTVELVGATGKTTNCVREGLKRLMKEGRLECVRVPRLTLDGRTHPVPGYRLKGAA